MSMVLDPLPTSYLSAAADYDQAQGAVIWTLPALAAGDFADLTLSGDSPAAPRSP